MRTFKSFIFFQVSNRYRTIALVASLMGSLALAGCNDLSQPLPAGTRDPDVYDTEAGALGMRVSAIANFAEILPRYIVLTGLLTDELQVGETTDHPVAVDPRRTLSPESKLDNRVPDTESGGVAYEGLHKVRASVNQALGALQAYAPSVSPALRGELHAVAGYAELMLADFFCSGVPLSTLDYKKDFTYRPGSPTLDVYAHAIAQFDSALVMAHDSIRIMNLARVGKGRVLLSMGKYQEAKAAVADVADGFQYLLAIQWTPNAGAVQNLLNTSAVISNQEGGNGLSFLSGDPRIKDTVVGTNFESKRPLTFPKKYNVNGYTLFPVADWIEARLIRAEAALQTGDTTTWIAELNYLRRNARVPGMTEPLSDLSAPASDSARVNMLMRERAFWLFLTGHRQGDLRRLIRTYRRTANTVYPIGPYNAPGTGVYGPDVVVPIPDRERINPLYTGCLNYDA